MGGPQYMTSGGTNGPGREDILGFIAQETGHRLHPVDEADIFDACDLDGARADAFMAAFVHRFAVDLAGFEPAFHHRDAGRSARFGWPMGVPHRFGVRLPLALSTLLQAAQTGRWPVHYPQLLPTPARDWLNWPLVLVALPVGVGLLLWVFRALI